MNTKAKSFSKVVYLDDRSTVSIYSKTEVIINGIIKISGSKNASLPIMAATLLSTHECLIKNIPELEDIKTMINLLKNLGVKINKKGSAVKIDSSKLDSHRADYDLVRKMRASILVLGPLLARKKKAIVSLPGG